MGPELSEGAVIADATGVIVVDPDGKVVLANPAAAKLFGTSVRQLIGAQFGHPIATTEPTEIDIVSGEERRVAQMRIVAIRWQGRSCTLARLEEVTERALSAPDRLADPATVEPAAEISAGLMHLYRAYERNPTEANTSITDDAVVCLLRDPFSVDERTLIENGLVDLVDQRRHLLTEASPACAVAPALVERVTGRMVIAHVSTIEPDRDLAAEVFVLAPPSTGEPELDLGDGPR